jgi:hypothetical protein
MSAVRETAPEPVAMILGAERNECEKKLKISRRQLKTRDDQGEGRIHLVAAVAGGGWCRCFLEDQKRKKSQDEDCRNTSEPW